MAFFTTRIDGKCASDATGQAAVPTFRELRARGDKLTIAVKCRDNADRVRLAERLKGMGGTYHAGQCRVTFPGGTHVWLTTAQTPGYELTGLRFDVLVGMSADAARLLGPRGLKLLIHENQAAEFWGETKPANMWIDWGAPLSAQLVDLSGGACYRHGNVPIIFGPSGCPECLKRLASTPTSASFEVDGRRFAGDGKVTRDGFEVSFDVHGHGAAALYDMLRADRMTPATATIGDHRISGIVTDAGMSYAAASGVTRFEVTVRREDAFWLEGSEAGARAFCSFVAGLKAWAVSPVGLRRAREAELAAIVNNVPEWAHPVAWGAAVLSVVECHNRYGGLTDGGDFTAWMSHALRDGMEDCDAGTPYAYGFHAYQRALTRPAKVAPERKSRGPVVAIQGDWEDD
jgi:hypothetical protein